MPFTAHGLAFVIGTLVYLGIRVAFKRKLAKREKALQRSSRKDRWLVALVGFGQVALPFLSMATPFFTFANCSLPMPALWLGIWLGIATFSFGLWLFWRSHADLGSNWSVSLELEEAHKLVTGSVYSRIRHPMHASFIVMSFAQAALVANLIAGFAALAAVTLLYRLRKPNEEAMMLEHFGSEYAAYMRRSGGVVPWLRTTH
jgi:protein-S-isoprenylcysteine O-methyltransferase Ste14